ncbi:MAG: tripartite tricarboxylate transporter substrate binding protein, partial [Pseudomonadota bacterium]
ETEPGTQRRQNRQLSRFFATLCPRVFWRRLAVVVVKSLKGLQPRLMEISRVSGVVVIFTRRDFTLGAAAIGATSLVAAPSDASASAYPDRNVTYVIGFNPGGESDSTARMQQDYFQQITGKSLVILNRPGAGGATAWAQFGKLKPDGHIVISTIVPHTILQPAMKDVGYVTEDIDTVYFFHYTPDAIFVRADSPFKTLADFIDAARNSARGVVTVGGSGTNSANHLAATILTGLTGAAMSYVPFKGSAPTVAALLNGAVTAAMSYTTQGVKAGEQVRVLGIATQERHPALPDVLTFREAGIDHIGGAYRGVAVPKGTPDPVRRRLSDIIGEINAIPAFQKKMLDAGYSLIDIPVDAVPDFIAERRAAYADAIAVLKAS